MRYFWNVSLQLFQRLHKRFGTPACIPSVDTNRFLKTRLRNSNAVCPKHKTKRFLQPGSACLDLLGRLAHGWGR